MPIHSSFSGLLFGCGFSMIKHNHTTSSTAELHEAQNEAERLRKQRRKLLKQRGENDQANSRGKALVSRPPAQIGKKGWKLRENMGFGDTDDDRLQYNQIRRGVRACMDAAGIETSKAITKQEVGRLFQCYTLAKEQMPFLRRFQNDWATREIIKDVLIPRRKYQVQLAGQASSTTAAAEQSGDETGDDPDGDGDDYNNDELMDDGNEAGDGNGEEDSDEIEEPASGMEDDGSANEA
ncbi:hypothetical protein FRC00_007196 [Tulasnella sp. 408]|nr:hypothetical protein FRC00_007196 [Tulasnella sp. 408]